MGSPRYSNKFLEQLDDSEYFRKYNAVAARRAFDSVYDVNGYPNIPINPPKHHDYAGHPGKLTEKSGNVEEDAWRAREYDRIYGGPVMTKKPGWGWLNDTFNVNRAVTRLSDILGRSNIGHISSLGVPDMTPREQKPGQAQGNWFDWMGGNNVENMLAGRGDKGDAIVGALSLTGESGRAASKYIIRGGAAIGAGKYATDSDWRNKVNMYAKLTPELLKLVPGAIGNIPSSALNAFLKSEEAENRKFKMQQLLKNKNKKG